MTLTPQAQTLALLGGQMYFDGAWPRWPASDENTERNLLQVLLSGRWAISGAFRGEEAFEKRFARDFASFCNTEYCVPTSSGTAALTIALLALGIGPGDEVLVPGLTWVACASAVVSVGAVPVLVDIDPENLAMCPDAAERAITSDTAVIMLVHPFCRLGDLDAFVALCSRKAIPLIEDCSQAHGAQWRGRRVGSFGAAGCFSMQQSKILTSGEGGAVTTNDSGLAQRLQQLRADGRVYAPTSVKGRLELLEVGEVMGQNFCLSEFQSAILVDRLLHVDTENALRGLFEYRLQELLAADPLASLLSTDSRITQVAYYNLVLRIDGDRFNHVPVDMIARALSAELGVQISPLYKPMNEHPLYVPLTSPRLKGHAQAVRFDPRQFDLPQARRARGLHLTVPNWPLLAGAVGAERLHAALAKVEANSDALALLSLSESREAF